MSETEAAPDYPEKVQAYLKKSGARRLPWGAIVAGGSLTFTTSHAERRAHAELAETAVRVLYALGVTPAELAELDTLPEDMPPEKLIEALEFLRNPPPAEPTP